MKTISTILLVSSLSFKMLAQLSSYAFKQSVTVSNTSTTTAINYQLKLTVNTQTLISASQMLVSGDDIRFFKSCNSSTLYNYWIESGINTPTTSIWVKVDTIYPGTSRTFIMAYGNPTATAVSSIPLVFNFAGSSTDSVATGAAGGSVNSQRGFKFSPNTDILVTSFGKREPNGTTRYVTLFDNTSTTIIAQQQVSGPLGVYSYSALPNPLWLTQGTQYVLQLFQGAADGYYFGSSSQIDPRLTYYDMRYCNSCTQNTFPTSSLAAMHYGYADFLFYYKNIVIPAPTYSINASLPPILVITAPSFTICSGTSLNLTVSGATTYTWNSGATTTTISVTPTTTTTYSVSGTLNSCVNSKTISISVNSAPIVTTNSGSICLGGSFTIIPSGASTYSYSGGTSVVSPTVTSSYSVTGTNTLGCSATVVSSIIVNSLPIITVNSGSICLGEFFTISPSGASTYSYTGGSSVVSPSVTSSYTVTGTNTLGCSATTVCSVTVNACVGIIELENNNKVSIYPNPTSGIININFDNLNFGEMNIQISNLIGQLLFNEKVKTIHSSYNLHEFSKGMYFVNIVKNNKIIATQKIIKD